MSYKDEYNYIGVTESDNEWWNLHEPPAVGNYGSLYFEEQNSEGGVIPFCTSFKTTGEEGYSWDMSFNSRGRKEEVTLTWNLTNTKEESIHFVLVDLSKNKSVDMNEMMEHKFKTFDQKYTFRFKVVAGSKEYVSQFVEEILDELPQSFDLYQNYPNPFNLSTTVRFSLPSTTPVSLKVYNILGQEVISLMNDSILSPGIHSVLWDGYDNSGRQISSGIYIYQIRSQNFIKSHKMLVIK